MSSRNRGRTQADADGRWKLDKLIPGVEYHVGSSRRHAARMQVAYGPAGTFKAEGGPEVQDVGIMEWHLPPGQ